MLFHIDKYFLLAMYTILFQMVTSHLHQLNILLIYNKQMLQVVFLLQYILMSYVQMQFKLQKQLEKASLLL